jgi:hypothetical protein
MLTITRCGKFCLQVCYSKIHGTIILLFVLYEFETWSLKLKEECRLRVFENRVLGRIFRPKGARYQGSGENYIIRRLTISTAHPILLG